MQLTGNFRQDLATIKEAAGIVYPENKIMRDLCICQAILESGIRNGGSVLSNKYNNLFGIKGKGIKTGRSVRLPTKEDIRGKIHTVQDDFAWNDSVEESFLQHKKILSLPRYASVWKSKDFNEAATRVRECGYATLKTYDKLLIQIYNQYIVDKD